IGSILFDSFRARLGWPSYGSELPIQSERVRCFNRTNFSVLLNCRVGTDPSQINEEFCGRVAKKNTPLDYSGKALFLVLLLAFALRLSWMLYASQAVESEGA